MTRSLPGNLKGDGVGGGHHAPFQYHSLLLGYSVAHRVQPKHSYSVPVLPGSGS